MPTYNQIRNYARLHNPRECQPAITAQRHSFLQAEANVQEIITLNDHLFNDGVLHQSREDVFNKVEDDALFPLSVLYWGFPTNMHGLGNHLYLSYNTVREICAYIRDNNDISRDTFIHTLVPMLNNCCGLGLSFFSKLFYFTGLRVDGAQCIIFDNKVKTTLRATTDPELATLRQYTSGTYSSYINYVCEVDRLSRQIGCSPDSIEYALFVEAQD